MCGRFFRRTPRDELAAAFGAELGHTAAQPAYNVAPGQPIITVRFNDKTGVRTLDDLQWGLIPSFAKDPKIAWRTINARAETVDTSGMLKRAFEKRRCLIAVDGFFEWKAVGKKKQPYAIAMPDGSPFALAGLWEGWKDPDSGEWIRTCTIVTTEPSKQMQALHDRMPVILHREHYGAWLGEESAPPNELKALLRPWDGELKIWPVNPRMNKAEAAEGPEVIEPVPESAAEGSAVPPKNGNSK
jgi:putative SOS response-associated peptidase YedK